MVAEVLVIASCLINSEGNVEWWDPSLHASLRYKEKVLRIVHLSQLFLSSHLEGLSHLSLS